MTTTPEELPTTYADAGLPPIGISGFNDSRSGWITTYTTMNTPNGSTVTIGSEMNHFPSGNVTAGGLPQTITTYSSPSGYGGGGYGAVQIPLQQVIEELLRSLILWSN